jgi:bifunctional NMN adenylyltransferase/nudix hydrolase
LTSNTPNFGVIVGRFQVHDLHDGHLELISTVRGLHNRVILFVGVAPTLATKRNPLDFITRMRMIKSKFPDVTVLQIPDMADDRQWSIELDKRIREVAQFGSVTLYGGRDSFVPAYSGQFTPVTLPLEHISSGEDVRAEISNKVIESSDFRAGVIYSTQNQWAKGVPTVDIAIVRAHTIAVADSSYFSIPSIEGRGKYEVLLGRKPGETRWRFPGGHFDPAQDNSNEEAAMREAHEEVPGIEISKPEYIGSHKIDDWRWKKEQDRVITSLFLSNYLWGSARAGDDLNEVEWFVLNETNECIVNVAHQPLYKILRAYIERNEREKSREQLLTAN